MSSLRRVELPAHLVPTSRLYTKFLESKPGRFRRCGFPPSRLTGLECSCRAQLARSPVLLLDGRSRDRSRSCCFFWLLASSVTATPRLLRCEQRTSDQPGISPYGTPRRACTRPLAAGLEASISPPQICRCCRCAIPRLDVSLNSADLPVQREQRRPARQRGRSLERDSPETAHRASERVSEQ